MRHLRFTTPEDVATAAGVVFPVLERCGVVLLPTETFYGLGASPLSASAVARICAMKGRPAGMAVPVLCAHWEHVESLVVVPERYRARLESAWPGALTAVLRCAEPLPAASRDTLAVRIPDHALLRSLLARVGPLTGTSANRHGEEPFTGVAGALDSLLEAPDLVLDGGVTLGGVASTVMDLTDDLPTEVRRGALEW